MGGEVGLFDNIQLSGNLGKPAGLSNCAYSIDDNHNKGNPSDVPGADTVDGVLPDTQDTVDTVDISQDYMDLYQDADTVTSDEVTGDADQVSDADGDVFQPDEWVSEMLDMETTDEVQPDEVTPDIDVFDQEVTEVEVCGSCDYPPSGFTLSSPANGEAGASISPNLVWEAATDDPCDNIRYTIVIASDANFDNVVDQQENITGTFYTVPVDLQHETTYYWKVTAYDDCDNSTESAGEAWSFTTAPAAVCATQPSDFDLAIPGDGAAEISLTPYLDWGDSFDLDTNDNVTYTLEISTTDQFNPGDIVLTKTDLELSEYTLEDFEALNQGAQYYWRVVARDLCGNEIPSTTPFRSFITKGICDYAPGDFNLSSPTYDQTGVSLAPTFSWDGAFNQDAGAGDNIQYILYICPDQIFDPGNTIEYSETTTSHPLVPGLLDYNTTYYWYVVAVDDCGLETESDLGMFATTLEEVCFNPPSAVDLAVPADGVVLSTTPSFNWGDSSGNDPGDSVTYTLQISPDPNFENDVIEYTNIPESQYTLPVPLQQDTVYYWRVLTYDLCGQPAVPSTSVRNFTTEGVCLNDPGVFNLTFPTDAQVDVSLSPVLTWEPSANLDAALGDNITYHIEVATDDAFGNIIIDQDGLTGLNYPVQISLEYGTTYHWRVTAVDDCGKFHTAPTQNFTTVLETVCQNTPSAFDLLAPADTQTAVSTLPSFDWDNSLDIDDGDKVTYTLIIGTNPAVTENVQAFTGLDTSDFVLPPANELQQNTQYYWMVVAVDNCAQEVDSSQVYSFTTEGVCDNTPSVFGLLTPTDGQSWVPLTETLTWELSADLDIALGDSVTYTLEIATDDTFSNMIFSQADIPDATFDVPGGILNNDTQYYWRVTAYDNCGQPVASSQAYHSFTTEMLCLPQTYNDTDFLLGSISNTVVDTGTVSLVRDSSAWTCYDGSVFPETVGWTENAPFGWATKNSSGGILQLSSIGLDTNARYEIDPSFSGNGWMIESRMQLVNSEGGNACAVDVRDGSHSVILRIQNGQINEDNTGEFYNMDPTLDYNTYKMIKDGDTFSVYVNDIIRLNGTAMANASPSHLWFHDIGGTFDSEAYWDYICYYNGGSSLPYVSSGTYSSEIVDTGSFINTIGSGAILSWTQNTPAGTTIEMEFCASDDPGLSGAACVSGLTAYTGENIPGGVAGRYYRFIATLGATDTNNTQSYLMQLSIMKPATNVSL